MINLNSKNHILVTGTSGIFGLNYYFNCKNSRIFFLLHKKKINLAKNTVNFSLFSKKETFNFLKKKKIKIVIHAASMTNIDQIEKKKK